MSFDLYFVPRPPPGSAWDDVMGESEQAPEQERSPTAADLDLWDRTAGAVAPLLPNATVFEDERSRQLDDGAGLQLSMFPGEISLSVPYWFGGDEADRVVEKLRELASAIEHATGLVAYDPQAGAAFLDDGIEHAASTFRRIHDFMGEELSGAPPNRPKHPWWAFWR